MSQMILPDQIENGDIFGMLIDDAAFFNLEILQGGLGLGKQSVKAWCAKRSIRPVAQGRTWLFTGATFRKQLEAHFNKEDSSVTGESVHQASGGKAVSTAGLAGSRKRPRAPKVRQDES